MQVLLQRQPWPQLGDGARDSRPLSVSGQPVRAAAHYLRCRPHPGCLSEKCSPGDAIAQLMRRRAMLCRCCASLASLSRILQWRPAMAWCRRQQSRKGLCPGPRGPGSHTGPSCMPCQKAGFGIFISIVSHSVPRVHALNPEIAERRLSW